jgi:hypothetical protein
MMRKGMFAFLIAVFGVAGTGWAQQTEDQEKKGDQQAAETMPALRLVPAQKLDKAGDPQSETDGKAGDGSDEEKKFEATHSEVEPLVPQRNGDKGRLHTFKLDNSGNIVAGLTFSGGSRKAAEEDTEAVSAEGADFPNVLQVFSPDFQLIRQIPTDFPPTALTIDQDGNYLCGGDGKLALFSPEGKLLKSAWSPNLDSGSDEERRAKLVEDYKKQMEQIRQVYETQLKSIADQIAEIEEKYKDSEKEMSRRDKARLKSLEAQTESYNEFLKQQTDTEITESQIESMLRAGGGINSLAVTGEDVFVTVRSGQGYEIWRTDRNFEGGEMIKEGLRGCCGQMDIDAGEGKLFIAENCEFQVGVYDRDGERLHSFGERADEKNMGFGSCCNPMNVICCANGDILTAESSIGKVKRFNANGEMTAYIGKARIGGGCKHVSIGFDASRDRYYVQYEDENTICVLVPNSEAESINAEASAARRAATERLASFDGIWARVREPQSASGEEAVDNGEDQDGGESSVEGKIVINGEEMTMEQFLAKQTDYSQLIIDSANRTISARMAEIEQDDEGDLEGLLGAEAGRHQKWQLIPQRMDGEKAVFDLEDSSGMVSYVYSIQLVDEQTMDVWIKGDFGTLKNPMRFSREDEEEGEEGR